MDLLRFLLNQSQLNYRKIISQMYLYSNATLGCVKDYQKNWPVQKKNK